MALVIATAGAAAPGVAAAAGAYGAAEAAAGALASWASTAALVGAASGAAYLATPSGSGTLSGAGVATLGAEWSQFATQPAVAQGASFVSGFVPGAGEAQDYAGFRYGIDLITQERLGPWERGLSGAMLLVPFVGAVSVRQGVRAFNKVIAE